MTRDRQAIEVLRRFLRKLGLRLKLIMRYEQDLRIPVPRPQARVPLTFRELVLIDLLDSPPFIRPERLPELRERLRLGQVATGAFHDDRLVAFIMANLHKAYDESTGIQFPLRPIEFYSYNKLIDPAYRNLGVGTQLDWEHDQIILAKGLTKKTALIDYRNYPNRRSTAKIGNVPVGALVFLQVFGIKLILSLPMKKSGLSTGRRSKRVSHEGV